ncbi:hypothetical protein BEWA_005930 [Theileria equi strain WA]|uniref:Matrin-type domain-containing protein n=1 Tax=Theileria equi strain WA TaxID=1537102 RepID=L0B038_THEEQ|nr:hypothetical protein BEWA_005930 [Theileria equi strain WA]AFZ81185.1 hypothetical protein BEWA_005930 [Theileria equi strain WA]|eukprot:XP_004830851.1 hypothetical protein BEWA_005930 [Theileria equi strain WA]
MAKESDAAEAAPASKVDDLGRKVWDRSYYSEKAAGKTGRTGDEVEQAISTLLPDPRRSVVHVPAVRENLKRRTQTVDLTKNLGRSEVINALAPKSQQGGFYCEVCDCLIKDSQAYLDHLNGRKHNRLLGMTMRVEKVDSKTVAAKLRSLASQDLVAKKTREELEKEAQERIEELEMYEREMREKRRLLKKKKRTKDEDVKSQDIKQPKVEPDVDITPEMEAMRASGLPISFS